MENAKSSEDNRKSEIDQVDDNTKNEKEMLSNLACDNGDDLEKSDEEIDVMKSCEVKSPKRQEFEEIFQRNIDTLQEKTKLLCAKLGIAREVLQHQLEEQQQQHELSPAVQIENVDASSEVVVVSEVSIASISEVSASKKKEQQQQPVTTANDAVNANGTNGKKHKRKDNKPVDKPRTRRELYAYIESLQYLLFQLAVEYPTLEERANRLAKKIPLLKNMQLFPELQKDSVGKPRQRHISDDEALVVAPSQNTSTANATAAKWFSSIGKLPQYDNDNDDDDDDDDDDACKREQPAKDASKDAPKRKRNRTKSHKVQESEYVLLAKYINKIVDEYLASEPQKKTAESYTFQGVFDDLEAYAERLRAAGFGRIVEEEIRINRKNNRQSFITMSADRESPESDGIILQPVARRYAFDGDIVRAFVFNASSTSTSKNNNTPPPKDAAACITGGKEHSICIDDDKMESTEDADVADEDDAEGDGSAAVISDNCPKSFVIRIVKQTDARQIVGTISFKSPQKLHDDDPELYYKLRPHDMRVPMVYVSQESCADHIKAIDMSDVCGMLYLAQIHETDVNGHCIGKLVQPVGKVGNLEAEIKAILWSNGLKDIRPYEERFNEMFMQPDPPIPPTELSYREDLRDKCVFTIDPLTARDLDDAVSVEQIAEDEYDVGVHISDVAYYLLEDTELDNIVKERATSIYLVNEVIHMLPQPLCFKCSLLPGDEKFAFSVFWRMNLNGEILGQPRFARSIISSCTQFAYEHAQKIIDNTEEEFGVDDFPTITNGFTPADIAIRVRTLHTIAQRLRTKRYDNGALSINNPKLRFELNPINGEPISYGVDGRQEANFLIEEFMLLANQSVAQFIYDRFPEISILRHHAAPLAKSMKALREKLANIGYEFDCSNSKSVYQSMQCISAASDDPNAMMVALSALITKPMARAKYFCSENTMETSNLWHYALSIPIYTHFTSPIRRYPDILVHRLLAAALNYCPPPKRTIEELHVIAKVCNDQKFNAKNAGDHSIDLFFKRFLIAKKAIVMQAVVVEIFQHLVNVVTITTGHTIAINYKLQKVLVDTTYAPAYILISEKNSKLPPKKLQLFSTIEIKVVVWDNKITGFFCSPDTKQRQMNSIEAKKAKRTKPLRKALSSQDTSNVSKTTNESSSAICCGSKITPDRSNVSNKTNASTSAICCGSKSTLKSTQIQDDKSKSGKERHNSLRHSVEDSVSSGSKKSSVPAATEAPKKLKKNKPQPQRNFAIATDAK